MITSQPVLDVLLLSGLAALAAAAGAVPLAIGRGPRPAAVGMAYASAAGLMLGSGYLLIGRGLAERPWLTVFGAGIGVLYTRWIHLYTGFDTLQWGPGAIAETAVDSKLVLQSALHSASEGVAIGAAMALDLRLGGFMAAAFGLHNVAEGLTLAHLLARRGRSSGEAAGICLVSKVPQPLLAIVAFALSPTLGDHHPVVLGFAAGTLLFLVLTELAPLAYERTGKSLVASLLSIAVLAVILLEDLLV